MCVCMCVTLCFLICFCLCMCAHVCFNVSRHVFQCVAPSDCLHYFKFTKYEVSYEESIRWQNVQVAYYIMLQVKVEFKPQKKI